MLFPRQALGLLVAVMLLVCTVGGVLAEDASDAYLENDEYAQALFGFEDASYYPYRPTFLDLVNYEGYIALNGGVKGDEYYAVYTGWSVQKVVQYLGYLEYWGYEGEKMTCDLPGVMAWRMTSTEIPDEERPLLQNVDVYYVEARCLLVIAYPYLDAWLIDEWLLRPEWGNFMPFDPVALPCGMQLGEDVYVTVEEAFYTDQLYVVAEEELFLYPYGAQILQERELVIASFALSDATLYDLQVESRASNRKMVCVRLSCTDDARAELIRSLSAALASADDYAPEYADCVDVPMLMLTRSGDDQAYFVPADEAESGDLWLVFPPDMHNERVAKRLYLRLRDEETPWIGDLRDWQYLNFWVATKQP